MKTRLALFACALAAVVAFAADVSGKWSYEVQGRNGAQMVTLTLKQDGSALTGSVAGGRGGEVAISDGKVSGDSVSFNVVREIQGNQMTQKFNGKVSGDEMKLTIEGGRGGPVEVTAKRGT